MRGRRRELLFLSLVFKAHEESGYSLPSNQVTRRLETEGVGAARQWRSRTTCTCWRGA